MYECDECGERFFKETALYGHTAIHKKRDDDG